MCVKFQLSVSESYKNINGIVLWAVWFAYKRGRSTFDLDSTSQRQFPLLPLRGLDTLWYRLEAEHDVTIRRAIKMQDNKLVTDKQFDVIFRVMSWFYGKNE